MTYNPAVFGMKKIGILLILTLLILSGCVRNADGEGNEGVHRKPDKKQAPYYDRSTTECKMISDANPWLLRFSQKGFYYFVMGADETENTWQFYFQAYDGKDAIPFCLISSGYVRDFSVRMAGEETGLSVLRTGDRSSILEFDASGKKKREIFIDETLYDLDGFPRLLANADGQYVIGWNDKAYFINGEGKITGSVNVDGTIRELFTSDGRKPYAVVEKSSDKNNERVLIRLDEKKNMAEIIKSLSNDEIKIFPFEDGFVSVLSDRMVFFRGGEEEVLIDLDRQGIVASQIQYMFGEREGISLISVDPASSDLKVLFFLLKKRTDSDLASESSPSDSQLFAPDGRRIIRVAIPADCLYQVEFHAKKYNQARDDAIVEIERFDGSLEDYLGKGNRPDVIMFRDHTELDEYVRKNLLVDLLPMFNKRGVSKEEMIPKAGELLGNGRENAMYAMAARFRLLLRTSDGMELDEAGKCDAERYLKWYSEFMKENGFSGAGTLENLLYANLPFYYEEKRAEASFTSEGFQQLMMAYKAMLDECQGKLYIQSSDHKEVEIARGPRWYASYSCYQLTVPGVSMKGLPGQDGDSHVYVRLDDPMAILNGSDCKEQAFDFILYYVSLAEPLVKGDTEGSYGKSGNTWAFFSVWEKYLRDEIYESKRPYASLEGRETFYTEEQCEQLKRLISDAVPETRTQRDVYGILMEEMVGYLNGGKGLEETCKTLQNRVTLYLQENR